MHHATVKRKIATSMIAAAVAMQSFVVAARPLCDCSAPGGCATSQNVCAVTGGSECRCSEKSKNEGTCCCSQKAAENGVAGDCCETSHCCHGSSTNRHCQCGCSDQRPQPPMPADSTAPQSVNWELFLEGLSCVDGIAQRPMSLNATCSCPAKEQQPLNCSVQTLYCTWQT